MPWNNNKMTTPVGIGDIQSATGKTNSDIGGLIVTAVGDGVITKWAKFKPIPVVTDHMDNQMMGMEIAAKDGNNPRTYDLRNDFANEGHRNVPGYVGNVIVTYDTTNRNDGFITAFGLKIPFFGDVNTDNAALSRCVAAMDLIDSGNAGGKEYNWKYEWTQGWYRFADFVGYDKTATFPFTYGCDEMIPNDGNAGAMIGNYAITSDTAVNVTELGQYALSGLKYGAILKRKYANSANYDYVLIEATDQSDQPIPLTEEYADFSIPSTMTGSSWGSDFYVYFVAYGTLNNIKIVVPLPYGPQSTQNSVKHFIREQFIASDALGQIVMNGSIAISDFGYDNTTIGHTIPISDNSSLYSGKCPVSADKLLIGITYSNTSSADITFRHMPYPGTSDIGSINFDMVDTVSGSTKRFSLGGNNQYSIYYSNGTQAANSYDLMTVPAGGSLTLYYVFNGSIWGDSTPDDRSITQINVKILWVSSAYGSTGYMEHGIFTVQANHNYANSGKYGNYAVTDGRIEVTSYANYQ